MEITKNSPRQQSCHTDSCTPLPNLQTFQRVSKLSPFFSHSCALFCTYQRLNLFSFKRFRTPCTKPLGVWGGFLLRSSSAADACREPLGDQVRVLIPALLFTDHCPLITAHFFPLQKDSSISATQHPTPLVGRASESDDRRTVRSEARLSRVAVGRREPKQNIMGTLIRKQLDNLELRHLHRTLLTAAFVLVQSAGLAMFMYHLVFLHPVGDKYTRGCACFRFLSLTPPSVVTR